LLKLSLLSYLLTDELRERFEALVVYLVTSFGTGVD
jgi:hypothetical protein